MTLVIALAGSCSGRREERPRAAQAVTRFYEAVGLQDGTGACELLAPETFHEVEKSAKAPCGQAITDADLPDLGRVNATDVYGNEARVVASGDTVFVSDFDGTWKIVAAGCAARGDLPHDCTVQGG
jgi:ketosteroid isomerase-like protein